MEDSSRTDYHIPLEELQVIYRDIDIDLSVLYRQPNDEQDFIENFMASKLWRLNNLYSIVNKDGDLCVMQMRRAQHIVYSFFLIHPRLIILKSRQQGISTFWLVFFFDELIFHSTRKAGLMSQGIDESSELLDKLSVLWACMDKDLLADLGVFKQKDNSKMFELSNSSKMLVRTSFRSGTLQMLHISELGKIANNYPKRAEEVKTGSLQAIAKGLPVIIESTAEGVNAFKYMWDTAVAFLSVGHNITGKDFYPVFLPWVEDPDCALAQHQVTTLEGKDYFIELEREYKIVCTQEQRNFWEAQFRELGTKIYQEYPATPEEAFKAALEGAYYGTYVSRYITRKHDRIRNKLFDTNLPLTVVADLGLDDSTVLFFFQFFNGERRLVHEYINSGKITSHYIEVVKHAAGQTRVEHIILPHDAAKRDNSNLVTREQEFARSFKGTRVTKLEKTGILDGINSVRTKLQTLVLDSTCTYALECLQNYSKEYDARREVWLDHPKHDSFSHGADCIRYYSIGERHSKPKRIQRQVGTTDFDV